MKTKSRWISLFLAMVMMVLFASLAFRMRLPAPSATQLIRGESGKAAIMETYGKLPMYFEANAGQTEEQAKFIARGTGYTLFLTPQEAVLSLRKPTPSAIRMQLVGANRAPEVQGLEELPSHVNYFIGQDSTKWQTGIPTYSRVRYQAVYPGVDLVYYGNQRQLEYDFIVAPGVDPSVIKLGFAGAEKLGVNGAGELVLKLAGEEVRMRKPVLYQERNGQREEIAGSYTLACATDAAGNLPQVGFHVGAYDATRPLVIDPILEYSTYLGGSSQEYDFWDFAADASGNAYFLGRTSSSDFPTVNAAQPASGGSFDLTVTKLNAAGEFIYSTYLGGSSADGNHRLAVDENGNAYILGNTPSTDFPTVNAVQPAFGGGGSDVFLTKLNTSGGLVYSTYLGGSGSDADLAVAVDGSGNAYVTGYTNSSNFPTANAVQPTNGGGFWDGFAVKLNATGGFVFSTYLGGNSSDIPRHFAIDQNGYTYVTGYTASTNFPTLNAAQPIWGGGGAFVPDNFVTKLNAAGGFVYSTYVGGSGYDDHGDFVVDVNGNAYVAGSTTSRDYPTMNAVQSSFGGINNPFSTSDAFVTKLNATGGFVYSTYLGGFNNDRTTRLFVDASENLHVLGRTLSYDFPTANAVQTGFGGGGSYGDVFITKLNAAGGFVYSTYLGGNSDDLADYFTVDASGNNYIVGGTSSTNFPTANAVQSTFGGGNSYISDVFVTKMNAAGGIVYSTYLGGSEIDRLGNFAIDASGNVYVAGFTSSANFPTFNALQPAFGGSADAFVTMLNATGGFGYSTYLGGSGNDAAGNLAVDASGNVYIVGSTNSQNFPTVNPVQAAFAGVNDAFLAKISPNQSPVVDVDGPYEVNEGASLTVTASGNDPEDGPLTYAWDLDNDGNFEVSGQSVVYDATALDGPGSHTIQVQVTDNGGLTATDEATVNVLNVAPTASFISTPGTIILGQSVTLSFSNQVDPSAADIAAGFFYSYDCENDGTFELNDVDLSSHPHAYPASGTFTAKGRIQDKDGGFNDYTAQVQVLTPQAAVQNLIEQVQALNKPQGNGLIGKLNVVIKRLNDNRIDKAIEMLQQFIDQVNVFISNGTFAVEEGQPLIDAANAIIAALSNSSQAAKRNGASEGLTAVTLPKGFQLEQNVPNPFNPATTIQFAVPRASQVRLKIYNLAGQEVATLVDQPLAPGTYKINWNASRLASGVYVYRLEAEGFTQTRRLLLMK